MINIKNRQVYSTEGKLIHRLGKKSYIKRGTVLPDDTPESFEEVDEEPAYSEEEYGAEVDRLIGRKYSHSAEIALINNHFADPADMKADLEYEEYMAYREECKQLAKQNLQK